VLEDVRQRDGVVSLPGERFGSQPPDVDLDPMNRPSSLGRHGVDLLTFDLPTQVAQPRKLPLSRPRPAKRTTRLPAHLPSLRRIAPVAPPCDTGWWVK
jgi:hypothetical protein